MKDPIEEYGAKILKERTAEQDKKDEVQQLPKALALALKLVKAARAAAHTQGNDQTKNQSEVNAARKVMEAIVRRPLTLAEFQQLTAELS